MAGIIAGLEGSKQVLGFPVLKNGDFLNEDVNLLVKNFAGKEYSNWNIQTDYHFGGYAKQTAELNQFILKMSQEYQLPLDPVYTGKMVAGVFQLIKNDYFARGSTIILLHTGGLRPA